MINKGKEFENRIELESRPHHILVTKIPEEIRGYFKGKLARVKTAFDFSCGIDGLCAVFDAKSTGENTFNFKSYVLRKEKHHQYVNLKYAHSVNNIAGYLVWFYKLGKITWVSIEVLDTLIKAGEKSLTPASNGAVTVDDNIPIDLRNLLRHDITMQVEGEKWKSQ